MCMMLNKITKSAYRDEIIPASWKIVCTICKRWVILNTPGTNIDTGKGISQITCNSCGQTFKIID